MDLNCTYTLVALAVEVCSVHDVGSGCLVVECTAKRGTVCKGCGVGVLTCLFFFLPCITTFCKLNELIKVHSTVHLM